MIEQGKVDDHTLLAYLDGELAEPEAAAVEQAVAGKPGVEARLRDLAFADAMLRASVRALAARGAASDGDRGFVSAEVVPFPRRRIAMPAALAAGLVIAIGAGALGFAIRPATVLPGDEARTVARPAGPAELGAAALQAGLENDVSGTVRRWDDSVTGIAGGVTPVRSWQGRDGQYCREFDAWREAGGADIREHGIACRVDAGRWRVRVRYYPE